MVLDAGRSGASWGTVLRCRARVGRPGTQDLLPLFPACSVHPGKDAATAAGQAEPPAGLAVHNASLALSASISQKWNSLPRPVVQPARWVRVPGPGEHLGDQEADTDRPCVATGQGAHEVQRELRGSAAHPSGPHQPRSYTAPQVLPAEPRSPQLASRSRGTSLCCTWRAAR